VRTATSARAGLGILIPEVLLLAGRVESVDALQAAESAAGNSGAGEGKGSNQVADVSDLPVIEVPGGDDSTDVLGVLMSGDGGWWNLDRAAAETLAQHGMAMIGPSSDASFEFHVTDWVRSHYSGKTYPVAPEIEDLRDVKALCICGDKDSSCICTQLNGQILKPIRMPGDHHFGGNYKAIGEAIWDECLHPSPAKETREAESPASRAVRLSTKTIGAPFPASSGAVVG